MGVSIHTQLNGQLFISALKYGLLSIPFLLLVTACLNRHFVTGQTEIISRSNASLGDSSLVIGKVFHGTDTLFQFPVDATIWIENPPVQTMTDSLNSFRIKIIPGTYSLKCETTGNRWPQLINRIPSLELKSNEVVRIYFYLGYTIE